MFPLSDNKWQFNIAILHGTTRKVQAKKIHLRSYLFFLLLVCFHYQVAGISSFSVALSEMLQNAKLLTRTERLSREARYRKFFGKAKFYKVVATFFDFHDTGKLG